MSLSQLSKLSKVTNLSECSTVVSFNNDLYRVSQSVSDKVLIELSLGTAKHLGHMDIKLILIQYLCCELPEVVETCSFCRIFHTLHGYGGRGSQNPNLSKKSRCTESGMLVSWLKRIARSHKGNIGTK